MCHTALYLKDGEEKMDCLMRDKLFRHMKAWVKEAGSIIREQMNERQIINEKTDENDLVTEMDKKLNDISYIKLNQIIQLIRL